MELLKERSAKMQLAQEIVPRFSLGMPHMDATGVSRDWLLRETCHMHWQSIARDLGVEPKDLRDKTGARALASVVACTLNGDATRFKEGDFCQFFHAERPSAENGWRSHIDLVGENAILRAEIVTTFARRNGPSNHDLGPAEMDAALKPPRDNELARRTNIIRALGRSQRKWAEANTAPPHLNVPIDPDQHINGVGLVYFAEIHKLIVRAERNAIPDLIDVWVVRDRRVHFFCNLDVTDTLELTTETGVQSFSASASVVVRTYGKRASDGAVVACAESIYGAPF